MAVASEALRLAVGESCRELRPVASGRSSSAWAASTLSGDWVIRVPIPDSGRMLNYGSEALVGELLNALGHPVATWSVVEVGETLCSVAPLLRGFPVEYDEAFRPDFAADLGRLLSDLHRLDASGFGPLANDSRSLHGRSASLRAGVLDRWSHASIWPFDESDLSSHVVATIAPGIVGVIEELRPRIMDAADGPIGVVHSDLHREHLLLGGDGRLGALLDFGDAFRGAVAWDFALLAWYYGDDNASSVATAYPEADGLPTEGAYLAVTAGLYKLAKNPHDPAVRARLYRAIDAVAKDAPP